MRRMDTLEQRDAFSVDQFARRNGVGRTLVYQEIQEGRLVARKGRGRTLITIEDAKAWREQLPKVMPASAAQIRSATLVRKLGHVPQDE
jgi:hypothetical protein